VLAFRSCILTGRNHHANATAGVNEMATGYPGYNGRIPFENGFLSEMLLEVYRSTNDKAWLQNALPALIETHRFWTTPPHLTAETGLSRYFDFGTGPAPEVLSSEKDEHGRNHYDLIKDYYREHDVDDYDLTQYLDRAHDQQR